MLGVPSSLNTPLVAVCASRVRHFTSVTERRGRSHDDPTPTHASLTSKGTSTSTDRSAWRGQSAHSRAAQARDPMPHSPSTKPQPLAPSPSPKPSRWAISTGTRRNSILALLRALGSSAALVLRACGNRDCHCNMGTWCLMHRSHARCAAEAVGAQLGCRQAELRRPAPPDAPGPRASQCSRSPTVQ